MKKLASMRKCLLGMDMKISANANTKIAHENTFVNTSISLPMQSSSFDHENAVCKCKHTMNIKFWPWTRGLRMQKYNFAHKFWFDNIVRFGMYGGLLRTILSKHIFMGKVQNFHGQIQISMAKTAHFCSQHVFSWSKYVIPALANIFFIGKVVTFSWANWIAWRP